ncbi:MAG: lysophospholipid acyltransferase family protein, partial [Bacteroidota bacterium]
MWNAIVMALLWVPWMAALVVSPTSRTFAWWTRLWARITLAGIGVRVQVQRPVSWPPEGAVVYVANHQAMLDVPVAALGIGAPFVYVARSELRRLPLVAGLLRQSLSVFIERDAPRAALSALAEAGGRLRGGHSVLFYPEGTRSYGGALGAFNSGGFRLAEREGVPVVPIAIEGAWRVLNEQTRMGRPGVVTVCV